MESAPLEPRFAGLTTGGWRRVALLAAIVVAVALPFLTSDYRTFQFTLALIYAIAILGLNMLTGYCGQISLGHGAWYAIGAYTAAILMDQGGVAYYLTLPIAGLVCLVVGFLFGYPAGRLRGHYLALATFALAVAVPQILKYDLLEHWTGGVQGIFIFKPAPPAWLPLSEDQWLYFFTLGVLAVLFIAAWNILRGRSGRAMVAIRTHHTAAEAMGVNAAFYKSLTFGISAFYTGVAGALGAIAIGFVAPDSFTVFVSIFFVIGMVVGGLGSIWGAIVGGLFITFVPNFAEEVSKAAPGAIYGVFMIAMMYFMPTGFAGFVRMVGHRIMRGWGRSGPDMTKESGADAAAASEP
jgi:branched-chain amino acid transport system permease protein